MWILYYFAAWIVVFSLLEFKIQKQFGKRTISTYANFYIDRQVFCVFHYFRQNCQVFNLVPFACLIRRSSLLNFGPFSGKQLLKESVPFLCYLLYEKEPSRLLNFYHLNTLTINGSSQIPKHEKMSNDHRFGVLGQSLNFQRRQKECKSDERFWSELKNILPNSLLQ